MKLFRVASLRAFAQGVVWGYETAVSQVLPRRLLESIVAGSNLVHLSEAAERGFKAGCRGISRASAFGIEGRARGVFISLNEDYGSLQKSRDCCPSSKPI